MIEIAPARESDVVLAFLKAEIDHSPHRHHIHELLRMFRATKQELIDEADTSIDYQNALRAVLLDSYRGYLTRDRCFTGFPKKVNCKRVELEPNDFQRLLYIANEPSWNSCSQKKHAHHERWPTGCLAENFLISRRKSRQPYLSENPNS